MEIGALNNSRNYNINEKMTEKNQSVFSAKMEPMEEPVPSDPLAYY